ncbi:MAG: hypothetical protein KKI02_05055 [Planctomycetes bacterium]|nr:hypothetical protein [Planctomycetota bacterium]
MINLRNKMTERPRDTDSLHHQPPRVTRVPPEIIFVPPPAGPALPRKRIAGILIWTALVCVATLIVVPAVGGMSFRVLAVMLGSLFAILIALLALISWRVNTKLRTLRRAFLEQRPGADADPRAAALSKTWKVPDRLPKLDDVRAALKETESEPPRARIVCFGQADVPDVGELHFEPEIITPTGAVWRQLIWLVIACVLIALLLLEYLHLLPSWVPGLRRFAGGLAYFLIAGFIALAVWVWRGMIRPTYIRMAPGVIQVLNYGYSKSKPTIRSYPMQPGTLAIFTRIRKHLILTLARGENKDMLLFSRMHHPEQRIERAWRAMLSTAPTPPLSNEELVG